MIQLEGFESLEKRLNRIAAGVSGASARGVAGALEQTKVLAVRLARGRVKGTINVEMLDRKGNPVAGRVFNDTSEYFWGSYIEFGTGIFVDDQGNPESIRLKRAKSIPWYIHVSMVPEKFSRYGYRIITGKNGEQFYEVYGMYPKPYMHPAAFQSRDKNVRVVADEIAKLFREVF